ncbi:MAG TPA: ABC transporter permease [Bryobacteraceae bacterium]|jgi:predicted permease
MRHIRRFFRRVASWSKTREAEQRLRAEVEQHLHLQTEQNLRAGISPREARRQAVLQFGPVEAIKEDYRDQQGLPILETLFQDVRHALRRLRMAPAFTLATVLTLALGIGATTSIFTLVHAILLKSLPVANPAELYRLGKESNCCYSGGYTQQDEFSLVSYDLYQYLKAHTTGFSELAAFPAVGFQFGIRRSATSEPAQTFPGEFVSGNYFAMFGISAYAGRTLTPDDDRPGAPAAAVMSFRLWQQKYGADPAILGTTFQVNDKPFTLVGIAPPGFFGDTLRTTPPDFFIPLNTEPLIQVDGDLKKYDTHWLELIGRLRPGATAASTEAEMRVALKQWLLQHWNEMTRTEHAKFPAQTLFLAPGGAGITSLRERYERWLNILMWVSAAVLLIVCANVANLMLVRGLERRRQTSLSMALGARASRVVRQALTESLVLSVLGGAAGLAIAFAGTRLILHFAFPAQPGFASVPIDPSPSIPVLLFATATSLLTGIAFGIAPAWMAARVDPIEALRGAGRSTGRAGSLPRKTLVVLQAALSLVLLSAAGLLTSAWQHLEHLDFGFAQDHRLVAHINPRLAGYAPDQLPLLYRRLHDSVAAVPGVSSVALCLYAPQDGNWGARIFVDGEPYPSPSVDVGASWNRVTAGYLDLIGNPIVRGRGITAEDTASSLHVAVINEAFARKFFKDKDPLGQHFGTSPQASRFYEVVGIAKDARFGSESLDQPVRAFFLAPLEQADYAQRNAGSLFVSGIVILTHPGVAAPLAQIRQAIAAVNPNLPVASISTMEEIVSRQFTQPSLIARLTSFFGLLSLLLASIGLYGVTAYNAGRRVNEIGVRVALGAGRADVIRLILRGAFGLTLAGLLLGIPLTFAAARFLSTQLYGMDPYNPTVTLAAASTLALSALAASLIPALRASTISPLKALRTE